MYLHYMLALLFIAVSILCCVLDSIGKGEAEYQEMIEQFNEDSIRKTSPDATDQEVEWCLESYADYLDVDINELRRKHA